MCILIKTTQSGVQSAMAAKLSEQQTPEVRFYCKRGYYSLYTPATEGQNNETGNS